MNVLYSLCYNYLEIISLIILDNMCIVFDVMYLMKRQGALMSILLESEISSL